VPEMSKLGNLAGSIWQRNNVGRNPLGVLTESMSGWSGWWIGWTRKFRPWVVT